MKSSSRCRVSLTLVFFLSLLPPAFTAAEAPASATPNSEPSSRTGRNEPLVIVGGVFPGKKGDRTPATVRNLIDVINDRYRDANITVVGVEDVVVENLTLQWRRGRATLENSEPLPPLLGILEALSQASGRKFMVQHFSPTDFVLSPLAHPETSRQTTEVFNIATILGVGRNKAAFDEHLRLAETEMTVLRRRYGDKHPRILEASERIDVLKAQYPPASVGLQKAENVIQQIKDVVVRSKGGEVPKFEYHPGANLLVVIGTADAIDFTRKVIAALEKNP